MSKSNKVKNKHHTSSSEEAHSRRRMVSRHGADAVKNMVNSEELRLRNLPPFDDYEESFEEQLRASRQGPNYQLRPGLRDREIWKAGIETSAEKKLRKQLQKEASARLKKERQATNRLIESIHGTKKKEDVIAEQNDDIKNAKTTPQKQYKCICPYIHK